LAFQTSGDKHGLSVDSDVALWLEKRGLDGEPELEMVGEDAFVLVTNSLHTEFDSFKEEFKQYTKRGFSMLPMTTPLEQKPCYSLLLCNLVQQNIPPP
jgi:hypothetical protein